MTLVYLKIEKYRIERTRPIARVDLVLTDGHHIEVDSQNEKSKLGLAVPRASTAILFGLRRPHAVRGWF